MMLVPTSLQFPAPIVSNLGDVSRVLVAMVRAWNQLVSTYSQRLNKVLPEDGSEAMQNPLPLEILTVATLPTASLWTGAIVYASDTQSIYWSNGTSWTQVSGPVSGFVPTSRTVTGIDSITGGGALTGNLTLSLVNDTATPGASKYYGTNASSVLGYFSFPTLTTIVSVHKQVFNSSGTYTPTTGMLFCIIECIGGGAGGGGVVGSTTSSTGAGGGGSGGYSRLLATAATIGASQTVTVAATAAGGTTSGTGGTAGNSTSVGLLCVANGGHAGGGQSGAGGIPGTGGAGASAGTGDVTQVGNQGGDGMGSATITTCPASGGEGGNGPFGGGPGRMGTNAAGGLKTGRSGATNSGAGGSGGVTIASATGAAGGVGATGQVIITEFCSV